MPVTLYCVYEPRGKAFDLAKRADKLAFVKQGFSWPALLFPVVWLVYQRMWIELVLFVAAFAALGWVFGLDGRAQALFGWVSFALVLLLALEANDLRGAALERRGYRLAGIAGGRGRDAAELAFFRSWLPQQTSGERHGGLDRGPERASYPDAQAASGDGDEVIGLFPRP